MAERAGYICDTGDAARKPPALHRRREARKQPGGGAVAHHRVSRAGEHLSAYTVYSSFI